MLKDIKLENGDVLLVDRNVVGHLTGWIDSLTRVAKEIGKFGIITPILLDTNKRICFAGGYFSPKSCVPMSYGMNEPYFGQYPGTRQVDVFPMYCVLISKEVVEKIGIPENLGSSIFVDAEYCLNVMAAGYRLYCTDKLVVTYQGGPKNTEQMGEFINSFAYKSSEFFHKFGRIINSHYKYPVVYTARAEGATGFANAARSYMHGMCDNGIDVYFDPLDTVKDAVQPTPDEKVNSILEGEGDMYMPQITWGQAPYFFKNSGIYKIGHCEYEADKIPESWVKYCNMMDEVWVPTEWDKKKLIDAGVQVPLYVIYQGIDPNYFHPDYAPMQLDCKETYKFVCNAAWFPRKNLRNLIVAFQSEFRKGEDVCLVLKTMNLGLNDGIQEELKKIPELKNSANVYVKEEELKQYEIPALYTACDCFVLPTHGEGWGLPIFEALACGLPVITTGYGAPNEILRDIKGNPLPGVNFIDYQPGISEERYVYTEGATWAEPNIMHLKQLMRKVYNERGDQKVAARKTSEIIRKEYSWFNVSKKIAERLEDIYKNKLVEK